MGFVVDKVSEDSFYENLLLGLSKVLDKSPCVSNLNLKRLSGVKQIDIRSWEHNNGVILPEDLREFYSSTDGFSYTYDFTYDYTSTEDDYRLIRRGRIEVNPISELVRVYGYETKNVAQVEQAGNKPKLVLSKDSKVFELCNVDEHAKVVLVYTNSYSLPSIWLYSTPMAFNYLAEDFIIYFRMSLAHLGIPCWQYMVSKEGLPEWAKEMFRLVAPGVLREDRNLIDIPKFNMDDINVIDPDIFITQSSTNTTAIDRGALVQGIQPNKSKEKKGKNIPKRSISSRTRN